MSAVTHDTSHDAYTQNTITRQQCSGVSKPFRQFLAKKFEDEIEMVAAKSKILLQEDLEILTSS